MEIRTPNNNIAMTVAGGFSRRCDKCHDAGIYWRGVPSGIGWDYVADVCYPCNGSGALGKVFPTVEAFDKARANADKAQARRDAKRKAEWEAGRQEREAQEAQRAIQAAEREAELATWKHLDAQVGDKVTVTGTVAVAISVETQFGTSRLIVVQTENNETVKMFTTASWAWDTNREDTITVQGTVKSFDEYEGQAQTMINRPKKI